MPHSYQPEQWRDLFVMLGSSATALLGLLFVVLTIHLQTVKQDLDFRLRTRNNSYHLLNVFILSALTLAPQPAALLAGSNRGFALVAATCVVLMVRAVLSSWALMFGAEPASAEP